MDDQNVSISSAVSSDQFALGKKWFWIGIVAAISNVIIGLIYGIALALEKKYRKEGAIIIVFAIVWLFFSTLVLIPWLVKSGILPNYQILRLK